MYLQEEIALSVIFCQKYGKFKWHLQSFLCQMQKIHNICVNDTLNNPSDVEEEKFDHTFTVTEIIIDLAFF